MTVPILAIVPARGGSKGVPRKNLRRVGGKPLFAHVLDSLMSAAVADRIVVSTEDAEIRAWASRHGHEVVDRPAELASDAATIAEVARHVADELDWLGTVAVLQPTSPLLSSDTIIRAFAAHAAADVDSLMTATRERHLLWRADPGRPPEPLFEARVNRQLATHRILRETGAIQIAPASLLRSTGSMIGERHQLFEVPDAEAVDIDTPFDFEQVRRHLERGLIVFRLRANRTVGAGHLYHCLRLAEQLGHHQLEFLLVDCDEFVARALDERGYVWSHEVDLGDDLARLASGRERRVVVHDVLDTSEREVLVPRSLGFRVVTIEDLGAGARVADWVVNALYVSADAPSNVAQGARFATLRSEFLDLPARQVRREARCALVTFGGTDPGGLGGRVARTLHDRVEVDIRVIQGPGAMAADMPDGVRVDHEVDSMASAMLDADVVITSAGRTVHEAAATGTPVVVLAQNAREATHAHLREDQGVTFLGMGSAVSDDEIVAAVQRLLADADLRQELSDRLRASIDDHGATRIGRRIEALIGDV